MKLAEALRLRADNKVRLVELERRLDNNVVVQEGEDSAEDVESLLVDLESTLNDQERLIRNINRTNAETDLEEGGMRISDALAKREMLVRRIKIMTSVLSEAQPSNLFRSRSAELRSVILLDVPAVRAQVDGFAADLRRLDMQIQERNWLVELLE